MEQMRKMTLPVEIRFRDIDAMGHVNNAVFFTYFEEGRKLFLKDVLGIVHHSDYPFIMAHIECDYKAPLKLGETPALEVWIKDVGVKKFTFVYRMADPDDPSREYCRGESVMVFYDYGAARTVPIPDDVLERIAPYVEKSGEQPL